MGLSALRKTQAGFDASVLFDTCEQVFDATACYFPVTFTPPPNDPHNISPDALRTGASYVSRLASRVLRLAPRVCVLNAHEVYTWVAMFVIVCCLLLYVLGLSFS